jgi:hypothetical protein
MLSPAGHPLCITRTLRVAAQLQQQHTQQYSSSAVAVHAKPCQAQHTALTDHLDYAAAEGSVAAAAGEHSWMAGTTVSLTHVMNM